MTAPSRWAGSAQVVGGESLAAQAFGGLRVGAQAPGALRACLAQRLQLLGSGRVREVRRAEVTATGITELDLVVVVVVRRVAHADLAAGRPVIHAAV
ncbi:hypothetical protein [Streptomyces olivaceus]|uniref:hypothetical protein n=1 Tax=Streptomyces olivaceus TaxID=47716 RepID=UPI001CD03C64|nr:hypothetical protein [Streptomyces olivaceus]MBZ6232797.1 hypothetical protein [Streptomyces olivaceus]